MQILKFFVKRAWQLGEGCWNKKNSLKFFRIVDVIQILRIFFFIFIISEVRKKERTLKFFRILKVMQILRISSTIFLGSWMLYKYSEYIWQFLNFFWAGVLKSSQKLFRILNAVQILRLCSTILKFFVKF